MSRPDEITQQALKNLQQYHVLMVDGHFDFGNGYHGRVYLNPHQLFRYPSTIWRFAQDLLDVVPSSIVEQTEVVAGPATGGALLAHTVAGLLDSRRVLTRPPTLFAPFVPNSEGHELSRFYRQQIGGRQVLLVDDVQEYRSDAGALCSAGRGGERHRLGDGRDLRSDGVHRGCRRA